LHTWESTTNNKQLNSKHSMEIHNSKDQSKAYKNKLKAVLLS
jgi:hypothetical protein